MKKKLICLFLLISGALIGLVCRIIYIQYVKGATYEKIVLSQQAYDSETIPFRRGDILDAKGTILATSTDVYNLVLDCKVLTSDVSGKQPYLEPTQLFFHVIHSWMRVRSGSLSRIPRTASTMCF